MLIRQDNDLIVRHCNCRRICAVVILGNRFFQPAVGDLVAGAIIYRQILDGGRPVVARIQYCFFSGFCIICQQLDRQFGRAFAVLVIGVIPDLHHSEILEFRLVGIRDGRCVDAISIHRDHDRLHAVPGRQSRRILDPAVADPVAIGIVHRQVFDCCRQLICGEHNLVFRNAAALALDQGDCYSGCLIIGQQLHLHAVGALSVMVVRIVPDLRHNGFRPLRGVLICDRCNCNTARLSSFSLDKLICCRQSILFPGVSNLLAVGKLRQFDHT